ncbi:MAG: CapA family protein [Clostridia bacterium]|nr:CapA family protein [Clostridia bacterium]
MKIFLRVIIILLAASLALAGLVLAADNAGVKSPEWVAEMLPLTFSEKHYILSPGEQISPSLTQGGWDFRDGVTWTSSDIAVATVDAEGCITALRCGEAVITATSGELTARAEITVSGDVAQQTRGAIYALSTAAGEGTNFSAAQVLCDRLDRCKEEGAPVLRELLWQILAFAYASGDEGALMRAIADAGFDADMCRLAAVGCMAMGEKLDGGAVISFVGDVTLARYNESSAAGRFPSVFEHSGSDTYPFDLVRTVFSCDDMTVVNFEGTLTDSTSHADKAFYFRGDPEYAEILAASSIEAASLENNHSGDYFTEGFIDTEKHLREAGVECIYSEKPLRVTIPTAEGDINVVLLAAKGISDNYTDALHERIVEMVQKYRSDDTVVIVNLHWGYEGEDTPADWQRVRAREIIDAGAALIVGHHPHVLQEVEAYGGGYIAYSLGNFAFGGNASVSSPATAILRARLGFIEGEAAVIGVSTIPCLTTSSGTSVNNYRPMITDAALAN